MRTRAHRSPAPRTAAIAVACIAMVTASTITAPHAIAAELYGITTSGIFVSIDLETGQATPLFDTAAVGGGITYSPEAAVFALITGDADPGSLVLIELDGTVTNIGPVKGLPPGEQKTGTAGYSGSGEDFYITFGQTGTFLENRIAQINLDAQVVALSPDLGLGDNDGVVWDGFNQRTLVHDFNAVDGLPRVAEVFNIFSAPYYVGVAQLPSRSSVGDSAVDPDTGRFYVNGFSAEGGFLVEVQSNGYRDIGNYNAGEPIVGISFGPNASCNRADIALPRGILDLADVNAFIDGFLSGAPAFDFDMNSVFDLSDVGEFINEFLAGCP